MIRRLPTENEVIFAVEPPKELNCPICMEVFSGKVILLNCSHNYCEQCFSMIEKECPICKQKIEGKVNRNLLIESMINNLPVFCRFGLKWINGNWVQGIGELYCTDTFPLSNKSSHERDCMYCPVQCKYIDIGCTVDVTKHSLEFHESNCTFGIVSNIVQNNMADLKQTIEGQKKEIIDLKTQNTQLNSTVKELLAFISSKFEDCTIDFNVTNEVQSLDIIQPKKEEGKENSITFVERILKGVESMEHVDTLYHDAGIESLLEYSDYIISGGWDSSIKMWDKQSHSVFLTLTCADEIRTMSLDGNYLYSGESDGVIEIWNIDTGEYFGSIQSAHDGDILAMTILNNTLFSSSSDGNIKLWDKKTLNNVNTINQAHSNWIFSLLTLNNNIISGSSDALIKIWDSNTLKKVHTFSEHEDQVRRLTIMNESIFLSGSYDNTVKLWDVRNRTSIASIDTQSEVFGIKASGNLIASGEKEGGFKLWDSRFLMNPLVHVTEGHTDCVYSFEITNDSIWSCSCDGTIQIWK